MSYSCGVHGWQHLLKPCPSCQQTTTDNKATPMGLFAEIDRLRGQNEHLLVILEKAARYIPHIPTRHEAGWGGANHSPCVADCPKCAWEKYSRIETGDEK